MVKLRQFVYCINMKPKNEFLIKYYGCLLSSDHCLFNHLTAEAC